MCIRDRYKVEIKVKSQYLDNAGMVLDFGLMKGHIKDIISCLLYTSDAADDLLCVDLGGRRIIKKKKT